MATRAAARLPRTRVRITPPVLVGLLLLSATAAAEALWIHSGFVYLLYIGISLLLGGMAATTLVWMLDAWRTPVIVGGEGMNRDRARSRPLLLADRSRPPRGGGARGELSRLVITDHPAFEVLVVVGSDDQGTRETPRPSPTATPIW